MSDEQTDGLPLTNLDAKQRKAFQMHLNDLHDDYLEQLSHLLLEAKTMVPNSLYDEDGAPLDNARAMLADYARQASIIAQDYYRAVRDSWAEAAGVRLPSYQEVPVTSDRAAWQIFGGYSDSDFNGLKFTDVINGRAKSGVTMSDLWASKTKDWSDGDWADFAVEMINETARMSARFTAERDPSRPRYARVPSGRPCAFCLMLASRGFAYWDEKSAGGLGNSYHEQCACQIVPSWGATKLDGYDPERYLAAYRAAKQAAGDEASGKNGYRAALRQLRRLEPDLVKDGVTPKPAVSWSGAIRPPSMDELQRLSDYGARMPNDRFTEKEKVSALRDWTGTAYKRINRYCFGTDGLTDYVASMIERIDEAIGDHVTQEAFTVDRQMRLETFHLSSVNEFGSIKLGQSFKHEGYMACSTDAGGKLIGVSDRIAVRILVPSGANAVYLEPITHVPGEYEVLLPRDRSLEYVGAGQLDDGAPILYCRLV